MWLGNTCRKPGAPTLFQGPSGRLSELADPLYRLLVLLKVSGVSVERVNAELRARHAAES